MYIDNILFAITLLIGIGFFAINVKKLKRNINLGRDVNRTDNSSERIKNMAMIALGQSKMVKRPIAGILHIIVYAGFIIINIEVIEMIPPALNTDLGGKGIHDAYPPVSDFIETIFTQLKEGKAELTFGMSEGSLKANNDTIVRGFNMMNP